MATAKTKPVTEEPVVTEPATTEPTDDFTEKVTAVLKDVLPGLLGGETTTETAADTDTSQPLTARQEEARTHNIVSEAVKAFKDEFDGEKKEPDKKEAETQPGLQPVRWIEKVLWGKE
jgi:hypothetical protein